MTPHDSQTEAVRVDYAALGRAVLRVRAERSLTVQQVADACRMLPTTISRIEREQITGALDAEDYARLCLFLRVPVSRFVRGHARGGGHFRREPLPDRVEACLTLDRTLTDDAARSLARLFRCAYEEMARKGRPG